MQITFVVLLFSVLVVSCSAGANSQAAFSPTFVNVISANFTGSSTPVDAEGYVTQLFDTVVPTVAQQGFSWNTTSGIGTCLVGGTYFFTWSLSLLESGNNKLFGVIFHNEVVIIYHYWNYVHSNDDYIPVDGTRDTQSFSFILNVNPGDRLEFRVYNPYYIMRSALFGFIVK